MKKIIILSFLFITALSFAQKKEKVKLIDIRTTGEHNRECIDCAENISVDEIYDADILKCHEATHPGISLIPGFFLINLT